MRGEENVEAGAVSVTPLITLNTVPVHRTLMEEYTGTWCGYCVRGFTGLEKLAELYPDDFVCVSFHNGTGIANPLQPTMTDDMNNILSIEYFDLGGRKLARAQQGVSIMRINYNNGKQKSVKVLRK